MAVLVTGGAGFLGASVVKALADRNQIVVAFDNFATSSPANLAGYEGRVVTVKGDLLDLGSLIKAVKEHGVRRVVHTAAVGSPAQSIAEPVLSVRVNVEGTLNILRAAEIMGIERVINTSTEEVYGEFKEDNISEDHPCNPLSLYGVTKLAAEGLSRQYKKLYGVNTVNIRTSWVYGPGLPRSRPPKSIIDNALQGKETVLFGAGHKLDQTYIDDCTQGILLALYAENPVYDTYHISSGEAHSVVEMVDIIRDIIPGAKIDVKPGLLKYVGEIQIPQKGALCIDRARKDLGYAPRFNLRNGLSAYINFLKTLPG